MARLSVRAYARRRGVSHSAVLKAIKVGRITRGKDGKLDAVAVDREWAASTNLSKPRNSVTGNPKHRRSPGSPPAPMSPPGAQESAPGGVDEGSGSGNGHVPGETERLISSYNAARAARENYNARLAKLDLDRQAGKLVDADEVRAAAFAAARRARDLLLAVPDRVGPMLVAADSLPEVHKLLSDEIRRALEELSRAAGQGKTNV